MNPLLLLALVGAIESIIYWWRIRTATKPGAWQCGLSTAFVCASRLVFMFSGFSAFARGVDPVWAILAYTVPASVLTGLIHAGTVKRENL